MGTKLSIEFRVSGGDIDFFVMDESEWRTLKAGEIFKYYVEPSRERVISSTIEWHPPANKDLCFVFSNIFSVTDPKTVEARIDYETIPVPEFDYPTNLAYLFIGLSLHILGIGILIGTVIAYYHTRKKVERNLLQCQYQRSLSF